MQFGICCSPDALETATASFAESVAFLKSAGVEYLEFPVASVAPAGDESIFRSLQEKVAEAALPVPAFNGFLPAHHRLTGPDVNLPAALDYCRVALERCKLLGGEVVVLGSGKARCVPDGFDATRAEQQFVEFCRALAPIAAEQKITICIEPLNTREDNLICSVAQGASIVDEVGQPAIQLLADFYHMMQEDEPLENVVRANGRLRHTHLADKGRVVPGFAPDGEADFTGFFRALKTAGYGATARGGSTPGVGTAARCSFEGSAENLMAQAEPMVQLLRARWEAA